jgi:hypothetical protein
VESNKLSEYLQESAQHRFTWGTHDCVTFALKGLSFIYGKDFMSGLPLWKSKTGATKAIKSLGSNLLKAGRVYLPSVGLVQEKDAKAGSLAIHKTRNGYTFFLCINEKTMCCFGENGLSFTNVKGEFWRYKCQQQ